MYLACDYETHACLGILIKCNKIKKTKKIDIKPSNHFLFELNNELFQSTLEFLNKELSLPSFI